ncbi:DNA repair protein RecO [Echinicola strongylocentroti]|uniref:DNA repair protein RecO n=1 Tax=Echinicola strongylocentroti TaxID=1795355 RepID=A0A2Z4IHQ7_9BACT|nr:DNA repair protein RecO [Echinicola strongylocentroti]AWW30652.1 DNA repair protein RecO [Echinicola strongylocentroti]
MIKKTQGIVIHYIKYRETSIIVKVFTRDLGLKSYIVNGVRSAKSKSKMALYQPLSLLELVVYDKENASLNRISEVKLAHPFQRIPFDFYRSGVAMFIGEILSKYIYENYQNEYLFDFIYQSVALLDSEGISLSAYPLSFLLETSRFLGFAPGSAAEFFEQVHPDVNDSSFALKEKKHFHQLLAAPFDPSVKIPSSVRKSLLDDLLTFYKLHLDTFFEVKSLEVLRNLM